MRKGLFIFLLLAAAAIAAVYLLIPAAAPVERHAGLSLNARALHRNLMNEQEWKAWWPGEKSAAGSGLAAFSYNGFSYTITDKKLNALAVSVRGPHLDCTTLFNIIALGPDSVAVTWEGRLPVARGPLQRIQAWQAAKQVQKDMGAILRKMRDYYTPEHLYTLSIHEATVKDSTLVSTYGQSAGYPTSDFIYGLIDALHTYIASHSATAMGSPMLNINSTDGRTYLTRVAIPVNKELPPSGNISYKWMLGGGNILVADVKGGPAAIEAAQRQLEYYVAEHQRIAPAIPFQSLITDRRKERDSSRWITRLYYPVM